VVPQFGKLSGVIELRVTDLAEALYNLFAYGTQGVSQHTDWLHAGWLGLDYREEQVYSLI
jgi:hypothetical protein